MKVGARFWRSIKQIIPNKKDSNGDSRILLHDDKDEVIPDSKIAEYMNTFFANSGKTHTTLGATSSSASQITLPQPLPPKKTK